MWLMSKRHGVICGNPAVADDGLNLPGCGDSCLSLGSLNLNIGFFGPYYSLLTNHGLGSQLQLYISEDRLFQFY